MGLLAYGAIGHEHARGVVATDGLELAAVCDTNPDRVSAALDLAPRAIGFSDATEMLDSGSIDLVVVSTPPNSHAQWARESLCRNLHVVLEKPMALTAAECDELLALADERKRTLVVYQNRRYDADFVALAAAVTSGVIGEPFQVDTFVGGFQEPCRYWHSDAAVSGGAIFDWGSHFIDQILTLVAEPVAHVAAMNHKRLWMHATNADHAQVTITFVGGKQATFTNSDLAAARRPKYYVLGTAGAIVGEWDPAAEPAVADLPAVLTLHRPHGSKGPIPPANVAPHSFHASLAGALLRGEPMEVTAIQSRDVVAIMEAAESSAKDSGRPVVPVLRGR